MDGIEKSYYQQNQEYLQQNQEYHLKRKKEIPHDYKRIFDNEDRLAELYFARCKDNNERPKLDEADWFYKSMMDSKFSWNNKNLLLDHDLKDVINQCNAVHISDESFDDDEKISKKNQRKYNTGVVTVQDSGCMFVKERMWRPPVALYLHNQRFGVNSLNTLHIYSDFFLQNLRYLDISGNKIGHRENITSSSPTRIKNPNVRPTSSKSRTFSGSSTNLPPAVGLSLIHI